VSWWNVEVVGVDEGEALAELVRAHADLQRLNEESADARDRRRQAARRLVEAGYGPTWIAERLGVTKQAVDGFLRYEERKGR
jgi:3-methyladenine DNA glycosylase Mpg